MKVVNLQGLKSRERWALYFTFTALPGACILTGFGWAAAIIYELLTWYPQQRFFDHLKLADTIIPKQYR